MTVPEIKETVLATARLARRYGRDLGPFIVPDLGEFEDVQNALDQARITPCVVHDEHGDFVSRKGCGVTAVIRRRITKVGVEYMKSVDVILWPQERLWRRLWKALFGGKNERAGKERP